MTRPVVIPRARRPGSTSSVPLERLLEPLLRPTALGLICIYAPPGGGKSTAIGYLLTAMPKSARVRFFDGDRTNALLAAKSSLAILACESVDPVIQPLEVFELCGWTMDDCVEYLAGRHREQAASVLQRLAIDPSVAMLNGSPELLAEVMDRMAADESLATSRDAISQLLRSITLPVEIISRVVAHCIESIGITANGPTAPLTNDELAAEPLRWFWHESVQRIFIGGWIADSLSRGDIHPYFNQMTVRSVMEDIAQAIAKNGGARRTLEQLIADRPSDHAVPMAVSILLTMDPNWRPEDGRALNLRGASLRGARWAGIDLTFAKLAAADCTSADFSGGILDKVDAEDARFDRANLNAAMVRNSRFRATDLSAANLYGSDFTHTNLEEAVLKNANCQLARFSFAQMQHIDVEDAVFTDADLSAANLVGVQMFKAIWDRAVFRHARMLSCNLEGLEMNSADFTKADLTGSLLTGTHMPGACFNGARLVQTGLAEIEWDNADLRDANLTHASFHLGSSRSGLVGSNIPCEGSRTGFYTDEFNEQDYKSPEEIRKASLVGADVRGAKLADTDFYLVDLRRAKYTADQHRHFVACGAILVTRAE